MIVTASRHFYDIHGIVAIDSEVPLIELEYFRVPLLNQEPSLVLNVSRNANVGNGLHLRRRILDREYESDGTIKYTEHFGNFGSQFSIKFSKPIIVTVNNLIAGSRHVLYVNLVEPLLRFQIIASNHVLLHSACIATSEVNGRSSQRTPSCILLSAPPDTGKTTTVIKCIRRGLGFLSDDMTIITPDLHALCFPKPMTISAHTFQTAVEAGTSSPASPMIDLKTNTQNTSPATVALSVGPDAGNTGSGADHAGRTVSLDKKHAAENDSSKGGLRIRSLVHSKSGRQFMRKLGNANVPIFTINTIGQAIVRPPKFKIEDIIKQDVKIVPKASIDAFYFLERGAGEEVVPIPKQAALERAVENSDDAFLFPPYKDILRYLRIGGLTAAELLDLEKSRISSLLESIPAGVIRSESRSWYKTVLGRSVHGGNN